MEYEQDKTTSSVQLSTFVTKLSIRFVNDTKRCPATDGRPVLQSLTFVEYMMVCRIY